MYACALREWGWKMGKEMDEKKVASFGEDVRFRLPASGCKSHHRPYSPPSLFLPPTLPPPCSHTRSFADASRWLRRTTTKTTTMVNGYGGARALQSIDNQPSPPPTGELANHLPSTQHTTPHHNPRRLATQSEPVLGRCCTRNQLFTKPPLLLPFLV